MIKSGWKAYLAFAALLAALFFVYDYHEILPKHPQSVHQWRQCDGASFATMYAQDGLNFFRPKMHNQYSADGRCIAEFPVLYYIDALLIRLAGHPDLVIRLVNLLCFYLGLLVLFRAGIRLTGNAVLALIPVALFHSLPVAAFYGTTSLPDLPALAFSMAGAYGIFRLTVDGRTRWLLPAMVCTALGGLIKPTSLVPVFAVAGTILLLHVFGKRKARHVWGSVVALAAAFLLTAVYVWWARDYNDRSVCLTFTQHIKPVWEIGKDYIDLISERIKTIWIYDYVYLPAMWFAVAAGILTLVRDQLGRVAGASERSVAAVLLLLGSVVYLYLFFEQFYHHDYYVIELYPLMAFAFLGVIKLISDQRNGDLLRMILLTATIVITVLNVRYTHREMVERYTVDVTYNDHNDAYFSLGRLLDPGVIPEDALVIVSGDDSPVISLYGLDRKGWTRFPYGMGREQIDRYVAEGARFLVHDTRQPELLEPFSPYLKESLIEHETLEVWSLQAH